MNCLPRQVASQRSSILSLVIPFRCVCVCVCDCVCVWLCVWVCVCVCVCVCNDFVRVSGLLLDGCFWPYHHDQTKTHTHTHTHIYSHTHNTHTHTQRHTHTHTHPYLREAGKKKVRWHSAEILEWAQHRVARFGLFEAKKQIWPFFKIGWPWNFFKFIK